MSWKGLARLLAPEMLNVGEEVARESEICALGLVNPLISLLIPGDALIKLLIRGFVDQKL